MNNIYIKTLKLGFDNPEGISFIEVVEKLNIDLSNNNFKFNYIIWFYSNFYNADVERYVIGDKVTANNNYRFSHSTIEQIEHYSKIKSFIKGDAVNKYIDYLELERTRKSSKQASIYSTVSIVLAATAIIISLFLNPNQPYDVRIVDESGEGKIVLPVIKQAEPTIISDTDSTNKNNIENNANER